VKGQGERGALAPRGALPTWIWSTHIQSACGRLPKLSQNFHLERYIYKKIL